jgi:hypothetical protein
MRRRMMIGLIKVIGKVYERREEKMRNKCLKD